MDNEKIKNSRLKSLEKLYLTKYNRYKTNESFKNFIINSLFISSNFYKFLLNLFGIKVGLNTKFIGPVKFIINGDYENIQIGDNVLFGKNVTLKIRENGKIIINKNAYIDDNVRIVAAREGFVEIDDGTNIGANTIINSGGIMKIGKFCLISNNCNLNSSSHGSLINNYIMDQSHNHGKTVIEDDVWLGGFVTIAMGSHLKQGSIVGANSFVNSILSEFSINVGCPTKKIGYRE
tara:strand:+ start:101 stop:802 length:702 start_codon:yes stop_codon:yes gene_type:complete